MSDTALVLDHDRALLELRRVGMSGSYGGEILGSGDILRPWQDDGAPIGLLMHETHWVRFGVVRPDASRPASCAARDAASCCSSTPTPASRFRPRWPGRRS
jgi:hypothetical protein